MDNLYTIKDWDSVYENSRSRAVKDLSWVVVPNHHDGEGYSLVMKHKDAPKVFSAWILMLQVASRCPVRGVLARDNGKPHNAESLSIKTRAPVEWFNIALPFLASEDVEWLTFEPNDTCLIEGYQASDGQVIEGCQGSAEERTERTERTEQKEQKRGRMDFSQMELPDNLNTEPFKEKWKDFCLHRKESGKPLTGLAAKGIVSKLSRFEPGVGIEALQESINGGWTGVFPKAVNAPNIKKELYHED